MRLETPGGGGYGDPLQRDMAAVVSDVRLGYISKAAARDHYGVAIASDGNADVDVTTALRADMRTASGDA